MQELVSIIIRTWNREKDLQDTLNILKNEQYSPLEIIVVDNGSTDNTVFMVRRNFPNVKLIELPKNVGVAATNRGIESAQGIYIMVMDDDAFPLPNAISNAVNKLKENIKLGIAALKIIDYQSGFSPQSKLEKNKMLQDYKNGIQVKVFQGGGFIMRREILEMVKGYPEDFFYCGEESDLAYRTINAGYEIRYFPEIIVIHRASLKNRSLSRTTYYETRNIIWLYWKYSSITLAFFKTVYSVYYLGIKALKNKVGIYYFKGLLDGLKMIPSIVRKREVVHTQTIRFLLYSFIDNYFTNRYRK